MSWQDDEILQPPSSALDSRDQTYGSTEAGQQLLTQSKWQTDEVVAPAPRERGLLQEVGRQVGLTARHGLEGVAQAAEIVTEPIRQIVIDPAARALGLPGGRPLSQEAAGLADSLGLPKPENATERVVGDAARFAAGGASIAGASGKMADFATLANQKALGALANQAPKGPLTAALNAMAANPGTQVASSAGTGIGAGLAREEGGGAGAQIVGGLLGGLTAAGATQAAVAAGQSAKRLMPLRLRGVDRRIEQTLERSGVDWSAIPERVRALVREDAQQALKTGADLDADALARLVDFRRVGATPTRGTVSLDPVQITREQNLARMGANATDEGLQGLARVQSENNRTLVEGLNRLGADVGGDAFAVGERAIGGLRRSLDSQKANIDQLYSQARDSAGRSFPLDGQGFTANASKLLDDNLLGGALPPSVQDHLNRIAQGKVPFTVDYAQQLATAIGKLQRGTNDGQARMALSLVRQALDDTPVLGLGQQGPAAGARVTGTSLPYVGGSELGEQAMQAFNRARTANREMMQRIERIPGLKAVYTGEAAPDDFIKKHIISPSAKSLQVSRLAKELKDVDPQAFEAVRASMATHLKSAALGGGMDEASRFSASQYRRALAGIGARKLQSFFTQEEIDQLQAIGRVASYTTTQPAGSAVNNSNSGAFLMGRGLDFLDRLSAKLPILGIGPTVTGVTRSVQQNQALNATQALSRRPAVEGARLPAATFGTLMLADGE